MQYIHMTCDLTIDFLKVQALTMLGFFEWDSHALRGTATNTELKGPVLVRRLPKPLCVARS